MDDPVKEISHVIETLTTMPPLEQLAAINAYFTPTASFTHPFCRTGSFRIQDPFFGTSLVFNSRWLIIQIYRWYKILSPTIRLGFDSVAFDEKSLLLYVTCHQMFVIKLIPLYRAPVKLTTVLQLTHDPYGTARSSGQVERDVTKTSTRKYYIQSQNDLYQTNEFIKFVVPFGVGTIGVVLWQFFATFFCVLGALFFWPVTWLEQRMAGPPRGELIEMREHELKS